MLTKKLYKPVGFCCCSFVCLLLTFRPTQHTQFSCFVKVKEKLCQGNERPPTSTRV